MQIHSMRLQSEPFRKIQSGEKKIEVRLYDDKRQKLQIGDEIEFTNIENAKEKIHTVIKDLHKYSSFEKLFSSLPAQNFGGSTTEQLLEEIFTIYTPQEETTYGAVGIELELM